MLFQIVGENMDNQGIVIIMDSMKNTTHEHVIAVRAMHLKLVLIVTCTVFEYMEANSLFEIFL